MEVLEYIFNTKGLHLQGSELFKKYLTLLLLVHSPDQPAHSTKVHM